MYQKKAPRGLACFPGRAEPGKKNRGGGWPKKLKRKKGEKKRKFTDSKTVRL